MTPEFQRPKDKTELEHREAAGLWKAIAAAKELSEGEGEINLNTILYLHKVMFTSVIPEIAGVFRKDGEDIKKLKCIEPPPGRLVAEKMTEFGHALASRFSAIPRRLTMVSKTQKKKRLAEIFELASWVQHQIVAIHPFSEGNGRIARLMTNVILQRYGLPPSQVKREGEDRSKYIDALCQIDSMQDFEPLKKIIISDIREIYAKEERLRRPRK